MSLRPIAMCSAVLLTLAACAPVSTRDRPPARHFEKPTVASPDRSPRPEVNTEPSLTIAVKGDWGTGTSEQRAISDRMCQENVRSSFDAVVTTGDNFYSPDGKATDRNFRTPERCLLASNLKWLPAWGNHDVRGASTAEALGATSRYYLWQSDAADFFFLDSNAPNDPSQQDWLTKALEGSNNHQTKIVVFHHPPFTVGTRNPSDMAVRRNWVPLFERYGVDLVLSGHNHVYEHSVVRGIHYVVSGGGGARLYGCGRKEAWLLRCVSAHHFLVLRVKASVIEVSAVEVSGAFIDEFRVAL